MVIHKEACGQFAMGFKAMRLKRLIPFSSVRLTLATRNRMQRTVTYC